MKHENNIDDFSERLRLQKESLISLLNHMPALTFTKDVKTGVYLACNQAFAQFANKETPDQVAGFTDFEIFDRSVAEHFTEDDKIALSMDKPYVLHENVTDAMGNARQFQTTKLKFHDENGFEVLLGMSMDVTEMEKIKKEREQVQAEYKKAMDSRAIYESIVDSLSEDYFNLYYVDLETNDFIEYGLRTEAGYRTTETRGTDFFVESKKNALRYVFEEDQERFIAGVNKENLVTEIKKHGTFIMQYRLLINEIPTYVNLKATYSKEDDRHIIIGVNNIDSQVRDRVLAQRAKEAQKTYLRLSALNKDLVVLYLIDLESNQFYGFTTSEEYERFGIEKQGSDFFESTRKSSLKMVHPEDLTLFQSQITKENILDAIEQDGIFVLDYRMITNNRPSYVRLKASMLEEEGKSTLIIGLMDEDAQIRREKKIVEDLSTAKKMATIDALTGAKNKYAFSEAEKQMNQRIAEKSVSAFSVVVFDLNNLKLINDSRGHEFGDKYIKDAYDLICTYFMNSPVYRIGGDEFIAILEGKDYEDQDDILEMFEKQVLENVNRDGIVVAFGCSRFNPVSDSGFKMVFARADAMMYREKSLLKSLGAAPEDENTDPRQFHFSHEFGNIYGNHGRKLILIADDIESNREILGDLLQDDYDVIYACDGVEAMEILRNRKDEIALVILDLYMPYMSGRDVMVQMQIDEELMFIPVIFISVDLNAELDCLQIGAMDFIPKPYPDIEIIRARISRCIELSENRDLIRQTQYDKLTGLFNIDYFIRYVNRIDQNFKGTSFDVIALNVNHLHQLNTDYGKQFGDLVLRTIGISLKKYAQKTGGIAGRKDGDTFLIYCPHKDDNEQRMKQYLSELFIEENTADKVSLRFGIYPNAQHEPDLEMRFERAISYANTDAM